MLIDGEVLDLDGVFVANKDGFDVDVMNSPTCSVIDGEGVIMLLIPKTESEPTISSRSLVPFSLPNER